MAQGAARARLDVIIEVQIHRWRRLQLRRAAFDRSCCMDENRKPTRKPRTATAAKPAAKTAPTKTAPTKAAPAKTPAKPAPTALSAAQWEHMVRTAAYFRAERRGFAPGNEWDDWLAAEAEVGSLPAQNGTPKPRKTPARKPAGT
jgi:hypothetical protein